MSHPLECTKSEMDAMLFVFRGIRLMRVLRHSKAYINEGLTSMED